MTARTLGERYELTDLIARGGMGSVHAAQDTRLHRGVAVKLLKEDLSQDPRFIERFKREARAAAALSHGNVARVFDYGVDDGHHFIVMEHAKGRDLARLLRDEGSLSSERARTIAVQIAAALGHAHDTGLIHRDVKPANVIVDENDHVKVTDFGIARAAGESTLTATGSVLGTAQYLAPEQASGDAVTPASDVYALGIVLYEILTGALPFTGGSALEVAMRHLNDEVPPPSAMRPEIPEDLDRVVTRATQKDPARRYADGNELAAALQGEEIPATLPLGAPTRTVPLPVGGGRWDARRIGRMMLFLFGALLALAAILAAIRIATGPAEEPAEEPIAEEEAPQEEEEAPQPIGYVVPDDIVGRNFEDVEDEIERTGFNIDVEDEVVDSFEAEDTILDSEPGPGSLVRPGGTITLYISSGDPPDDDDNRGQGRGRGRGNDGRGDDD